MFISFSKTVAKFGGFRLSVGTRVSKSNFWWAALIVMFVAIFKLTWYMMLLCGWMMYAMCYGIYWCIKKIVETCKKRKDETTK